MSDVAKHTPGPWNKEAIRRILRFASKNPSYCGLDDEELSDDYIPDDDDTDLVTAAPELLDSLNSLLQIAEWVLDAADIDLDETEIAVKKTSNEEVLGKRTLRQLLDGFKEVATKAEGGAA